MESLANSRKLKHVSFIEHYEQNMTGEGNMIGCQTNKNRVL